MADVIQIKGLDELLKKLDSLQKLDAIKPALKAAAVHVKGKIAQYPPSSEANDPNRRKWYERGYGPKWRLVSGEVHGKRTSETLGRKWTTRSLNQGLTQVVGNNVSYGPFVQSAEKQAAFHRKRGWKTTEDVAAEEADTVNKFVKDEIDKVLEGR